MTKQGNNKLSVFKPDGFEKTIEALKDEIVELYKSDSIPWVIGYSGGKDSTAIAQLIWLSLEKIPPEQRNKPVHIISTDTMVENPIVSEWVNASVSKMAEAAKASNVPIKAHLLHPDVPNTFWVSLIGKGYPAPRNKFRWCTERLKIKPSNTFIQNVVRENGEAILVLGTRRAESSKRSHNMDKHSRNAVRKRLVPNASLPNSLVYTPIEDWSNDDVWVFLMQVPNPWGHSNKDLMGMYKGATEDGECPLVVDSSTPSCGSSRFGCWVCTLVDQDKSMAAMVQNDHEKEWMLPLLELRNELDFRTEKARQLEKTRRDFRRLSGKLTGYEDSQGEYNLVRGPYTAEAREHWLRRVLGVQEWLHENAPEDVGKQELITEKELHEIRRIWVMEKHEIEDRLPVIYEEETGREFPGAELNQHQLFDKESLDMLKDTCKGDSLHYEMLRNMLDVEQSFQSMIRRRGLFDAIENEIKRCFYENEGDALESIRAHKGKMNKVEERIENLNYISPGGDEAGLVALEQETEDENNEIQAKEVRT
jgi:DNA sulfur modification protein DndC